MSPAFEKIMCAVDFSKFSKGVIRAGSAMAKRFGSTLLVFHSTCFPRERFSEVFDSKEAKGEKEAIRFAHEKIEALMKESTVPWKPVVMAGDPVKNIALAARQEGVHMVMAASYGMSGFKRLFLGTVVERFSGLLEPPLLVLRHAGDEENDRTKKSFQIGKIAVCCTLNPLPRALVDHGIALAIGWKAELILLHAMEAPPGEDEVDTDLCSYEEAQKKMQDRIRSQLMDFVPQRQRDEMIVSPVILRGVPGEQIRYFTKASAIDLVIVGGPRRGPVGSLIIGSTTQFLIRHAPCNILSVASG